MIFFVIEKVKVIILKNKEIEVGMKNEIKKRILNYYINKGFTCTEAALFILSEEFEITLNVQVLQAAIGMNGGGGCGKQCGLVEGGLMFIGIFFSQKGKSKEQIQKICSDFIKIFEEENVSVVCEELIPDNEFETKKCRHLVVSAIFQILDFVEGACKNN